MLFLSILLSIAIMVVAVTNGDVDQLSLHPSAPLTSDEIRASAELIRGRYPTGTKLLFKQVTLHEPAKEQLAPFLDAEIVGRPCEPIDRRSFITYYIRNTVGLFPFRRLERWLAVADQRTGQIPRGSPQSGDSANRASCPPRAA